MLYTRPEKEKFKAVCDAVEEAHAKHQPVLVGTITIETFRTSQWYAENVVESSTMY